MTWLRAPRALPSTWRTLVIAVAGLLLPLLWPGLRAHLFTIAGGMTMRAPSDSGTLEVLHLGADALIAVAYTFIAGVLAFIVRRHRHLLPFDWVVLSFGLFIVACGGTHFMHVLTWFVPVLWLDGYVRALTAIVSVATALALPALVPRIALLLDAERAVAEQRQALERANAALQEALARAEVLAALGEALQSAATGEEAQRRALERLGPALHATAMLVVTWDQQRVATQSRWGALPRSVERAVAQADFSSADAPVLFEALERGAPRYVDEYGDVSGAHPELSALAFAVEPVLHRSGGVVGALTVWRGAVGGWSDSERDLLRRAAATVGLALERMDATRQLTAQNEALEVRTRELSAVNGELEAFVYSVSHDLRAPVRHVTAFADLALDAAHRTDPERLEHALHTIQGAGRRMNALIDGMLALSQVGRQAPARGAVDLNALVEQARRDVEQEHPGRRINWRVSTLPTVWGDAVLLQQVMTNLLSNAVKYSSTRERSDVQVTAVPNGAQWVITVSDNGVGFDERHAQRLFGVFQRLHPERDFAGTGVGLATVRRIVQKHGGEVFARGEPGRGAQFGFTLPVERAPS